MEEPTATKEKRKTIPEILAKSNRSFRLVGPNNRLQEPVKRIVENLIRAGVDPVVIAGCCGLSYSSVMYHRRRVLTGRGRKK